MNILSLIIVFAVIIFSMMLHELAHGGVAYLLGDDTAKSQGRLSLNPLVHLDPVMSILMPLMLFFMGGPIFGGAKPVPVDSRNLKWGPWGMALVAVAGPLTNFVLAFVAYLIAHFSGVLASNGMLSLVFAQFIMINLGFGIFNLIPVQPLDGSRILYALMPDAIRSIMDRIELFGMYIVIILVTVFSTQLGVMMSSAMNEILNFFQMIVGFFG